LTGVTGVTGHHRAGHRAAPRLDGADLTAGYEWQVYQQAADASLQGPVDLGIQFADELKLAVDAVAVYGQALAAAQAAAIEAGQRYATVSLQVQLARQQQDELQRYVDALVKGEAAPTALMQRFYERYLNASSYGYVEVDGKVDNEVSYAYFQPTPFGEWHISVIGDDLDLSGVTRVVMQFAGSVIPEA
jgi:hypothetical protein